MNDKILHISNTEFDVNTIYPNSVLLTSCDQPRQGNEYHTSIGDMPAGDIMKIVSEFDTINFLDQSFSSESDLWKETVVLLTALSHQHKVCNFNPGKVKNFLDYDLDRTDEPTLWVFGCSHSHGTGLSDINNRYSNIISKHLNLPLRSITKPGSSTQWSHRHLINTNFISGDVVIWQLTTPDRLTMMLQQPTEIMLARSNNRSLIDCWTDQQTEFYQLSLMNTAVRYLRSQPVKFVITSINSNNSSIYSYLTEYTKYPEYCYCPNWCCDLGSDNLHAGPLSHKALALSLINQLQLLND
jgi:hypothetical protein